MHWCCCGTFPLCWCCCALIPSVLRSSVLLMWHRRSGRWHAVPFHRGLSRGDLFRGLSLGLLSAWWFQWWLVGLSWKFTPENRNELHVLSLKMNYIQINKINCQARNFSRHMQKRTWHFKRNRTTRSRRPCKVMNDHCRCDVSVRLSPQFKFKSFHVSLCKTGTCLTKPHHCVTLCFRIVLLQSNSKKNQ